MTYFPLRQTTCFFIPLVAPCKPLLLKANTIHYSSVDYIVQYGYNIIRILLLCIGHTGAGGAFMNIRPSAAIRQNYNEIADLCRETECVEARATRLMRSLP